MPLWCINTITRSHCPSRREHTHFNANDVIVHFGLMSGSLNNSSSSLTVVMFKLRNSARYPLYVSTSSGSRRLLMLRLFFSRKQNVSRFIPTRNILLSRQNFSTDVSEHKLNFIPLPLMHTAKRNPSVSA